MNAQRKAMPNPDHPYGKISYSFVKALALAQVRERKIQSKEMKIAAAKKALSILNKMKPGPFRAKYTSRTFSNLNKLRAAK